MALTNLLEKQTVKKMIQIFCHGNHGTSQKELCQQCQLLLNYAEERVDKCIFGEKKPVCAKCNIHCYKSKMKNSIKEVMRYSGPRMLYKSPLLTLRYFLRKYLKKSV